MIRETNATPFTKRHHYAVEEVSVEEFLAVINQQNQGDDSNTAHFNFIRSKFDQGQK